MSSDGPLMLACIVVCLLGATAGHKREALGQTALWVVVLILAGLLGVRSANSGHLPVFGTFEMNTAETLCLLLAAVLLRRSVGEGYLTLPLVVAALTCAHGLTLYTQITPQTISEQSLWVDAHAILAWLAWPCYWHAWFLARRDTPTCEDLALRWLGYGFLAHTALAFVGIYYATVLFSQPWGWDPVQTLGLLSWLLAGAAIHFRLFFNLSSYRQRWFLALVVLSYVLSGKLLIYLRMGQSWHVFELGAMAGPD